MEAARGPNCFYVMATGQVEACKMANEDNLYVRYSFNYGHDWTVLHGLENGISQISRLSAGQDESFVWNYPIDLTWRSTNVHGWPQIVVSVYGMSSFGNDNIKGYGCVHLPLTPGRHVRYVRLYTPVSSSMCRRLTAWLTGNPPEFFDAKFVAQGKGREVTRVKSKGTVKIVINITSKSMSEWGYDVDGERHGQLTSAPFTKAKPAVIPSTAMGGPSSASSGAAAFGAGLKARTDVNNKSMRNEYGNYDNSKNRDTGINKSSNNNVDKNSGSGVADTLARMKRAVDEKDDFYNKPSAHRNITPSTSNRRVITTETEMKPLQPDNTTTTYTNTNTNTNTAITTTSLSRSSRQGSAKTSAKSSTRTLQSQAQGQFMSGTTPSPSLSSRSRRTSTSSAGGNGNEPSMFSARKRPGATSSSGRSQASASSNPNTIGSLLGKTQQGSGLPPPVDRSGKQKLRALGNGKGNIPSSGGLSARNRGNNNADSVLSQLGALPTQPGMSTGPSLRPKALGALKPLR